MPMTTVREDKYEITRVTRHIPKPFDTVLAKLQSSIVQPSASGPSLGFLKQVQSQDAFETAINEFLGPHGFMQFFSIDHGAWTPLYGVGVGRKSVRIVFGNPLIAITMLRHDLKAGLFVPVEALVLESEDGKGTEVVMVSVMRSLLSRYDRPGGTPHGQQGWRHQGANPGR